MADLILSRSGLPQPPQTRGLATAMLSVGEDISDIGALAYRSQEARANSWLQYDLKLKEMEKKYSLDVQEIAARKAAEVEVAREKEKIKGESRDKDRDWLTAQIAGDPTDPRWADVIEDESGGHSVPNQAKYAEGKRRAGVAAHVISGNAGHYDDYERGARTRLFTEKLEGAPDLETQRRIRQAEKGDQRHRQGESGAQDDWGGQITPTDVSKSKVAENFAQADQAKASAERQREGAKGDKIDRRLTAEDKRIAMIEGMIARKQKLMAESFDDEVKAGYQREIDDLERRRLAAEEERSRIADEFNARQRIPGKNEKGKAPYPDGTRLRGKDGKMYVVRNGKPVLEGK